MNILFIKPAWFRQGPFQNCVNVRTGPLSLALLAALSEGHFVKIIDGDIEPIVVSDKWDLVAISTATSSANEAYAISDQFRAIGVPVILGGVHPSMMPQEALSHADSVVIGEAEPIWQAILNDFPNFSKIYRSETLTDIENLPLPRRDLFHPSYKAAAIQATRGCINNCQYCYLQNVPWKEYRKRSVESFEREISQIKEKYLFFADDNLFIDKAYTLEIARTIMPYKKYWSCQAPIDIGEDDSFIKELAKTGLSGVMLGVDSIQKETLDSASKKYMPQRLHETVQSFHRYGVGVGAMLVFGFDCEDESVFDKTLQFLDDAKFDSAGFFALTPFPGTHLFDAFEKEGRIITKDWSQYNLMNTVFMPKQMSPEVLTYNVRRMYKEFIRRKIRRIHKHIPFYCKMIIRSPQLAWDLRSYLYVNPF